MKRFADLSLSIKLNLIIMLALGLLAMAILGVEVVASNSLTSELGQSRIEQETLLIEQRLAEIQQSLNTAANLFRNTPGLVTAVDAADLDAIRSLTLGAVPSLQVDDFDVFDENGTRLLDSVTSTSPYESEEAPIIAQTLLGIQRTTLIKQVSGDTHTVLLISARPLRNNDGTQVGGFVLVQVLDDEFLNGLNFGRAGVELSLIVDNQIAAQSSSQETDSSPNEGQVFTLQQALVDTALAGTVAINPQTIFSQAGISHTEAYLPVRGLDDRSSTAVLAVRVNTQQIVAFQRALLANSTVTIVVLAVGIIGLIVLLVRSNITQRISALQQTSARLAQGQYDERVTLRGEDEIGQLGQAFNNMANDIQKRQSDLESLNQSLDQIVVERTAELKTARDEAVTAQWLATESSRLKSEFLATMSHELRTPLNAMIGFTGILLMGMRGEIDEDAHHMIERIEANSKRLLGLINDVLDLAKIEAGRMEVVEMPIAPRALVKAWQNQMSVLGTQNGLGFEVEFDETLPERILGDEARLSQITTNLLSNAFKFTRQGSVRLIVKRSNDQWIIQVTDTGVGIPPHAINYIFDEFRQVDGTYSRAYGGTGLGLAIVRKLARTMYGTVQVQSDLGVGSVFTVTLPLKPVNEAQPTLA